MYDDIFDFQGGFASIRKNDLYGFIDKQGNEVVPCQYEETGNFYDDLASVEDGSGCGYINTQGNIVIPLNYSYAGRFNEGLAAVKSNGWKIIDTEGNIVINSDKFDLYEGSSVYFEKVEYSPAGFFSDKCLLVGKYESSYEGSGKTFYTYMNKTGDLIFQDGGFAECFLHARNFSNRLALVKKDDESGYKYIKKDGSSAFSEEFSYGTCFDSLGRACVQSNENGLWGVINRKGEYLCTPRFSEIAYRDYGYAVEAIKEDCFAVKNNDKWGFADVNGNEIIQYKYNELSSFCDGLALVWEKGKYEEDSTCYYINKAGERAFGNKEFPNAESFSDGIAKVWENNHPALINTNGETIFTL